MLEGHPGQHAGSTLAHYVLLHKPCVAELPLAPQEYANLYAKLSIMQQELQVLILEGLLRESDAAAEVEAHLRDELAQQRQQQQQQQEQQQPVGSSQAVHA